eukprot:m.343281 g.343281  ORF g.343281 m.343281 type:complete len:241 (+) comp19849_c2_seq3:362-1084(+)
MAATTGKAVGVGVGVNRNAGTALPAKQEDEQPGPDHDDAEQLAAGATALATELAQQTQGGQQHMHGTDHGGDEEISAPLVFQCNSCRLVLGDSFSWVCADEQMQTVTLQAAVPGIKFGPRLKTSESEHDMGSTYLPFSCPCGEQVGRVYKTTSRRLDHIRDMMTFDIGKITSYQLGVGLAPSTEDLLDVPSAQQLQSQIVKIQRMILVFNERFEHVESTLADVVTSKPDAGPVSSKRQRR